MKAKREKDKNIENNTKRCKDVVKWVKQEHETNNNNEMQIKLWNSKRARDVESLIIYVRIV